MEGVSFSQRQLVQDAHVSVNWDISPKDNLTIKFFQQFIDSKEYYEIRRGSIKRKLRKIFNRRVIFVLLLFYVLLTGFLIYFVNK